MTSESTLITGGIGLVTSAVMAQAPINDWASAITQLIIAVVTILKLFPKKPKS